MITPEQRQALRQKIINRLDKLYARRYQEDPAWAWTNIKAAVAATTKEGKREIIGAMENTMIVRDFIKAAATDEADSILSDDMLSLEELAKILEDK